MTLNNAKEIIFQTTIIFFISSGSKLHCIALQYIIKAFVETQHLKKKITSVDTISYLKKMKQSFSSDISRSAVSIIFPINQTLQFSLQKRLDNEF